MGFINSFLGANLGDALKNLWESTGFKNVVPEYYVMNGYSWGIWGLFLMMLIACVFVYLAIVKKFEPNLLLSIAFGMFVINIPGAYSILYGTGGYTVTDLATNTTLISGSMQQVVDFLNTGAYNSGIVFNGNDLAATYSAIKEFCASNDMKVVYEIIADKGLFYYLYKGVDWVIFPPLIFLGIGAMTDFGPLIAIRKVYFSERRRSSGYSSPFSGRCSSALTNRRARLSQ